MVRSVTPRKSDFPESWLTTSSEMPPEVEISGQKIGETVPTQSSEFDMAASFIKVERKRCITAVHLVLFLCILKKLSQQRCATLTCTCVISVLSCANYHICVLLNAGLANNANNKNGRVCLAFPTWFWNGSLSSEFQLPRQMERTISCEEKLPIGITVTKWLLWC